LKTRGSVRKNNESFSIPAKVKESISVRKKSSFDAQL